MNVISVSFLCLADCILTLDMFASVAVTVLRASVTMTVIVEEEQACDVRGQSETADNEDEDWLSDFLRLDETLYGFKEDRDTKSD